MTKTHQESNETFQQFKSDCSKCSGLCCTALFFSKMDGFPKDKIAGKPCINLQQDFKCKIHTDLDKKKMKGCIGYDCFGAGQHVTQRIYEGQTWQDAPIKAQEIFDVFVLVFQLHQIRYFLAEALTICHTKLLANDIQSLIMENETMCDDGPKVILDLDIESYRNRANILIKQVCNIFLDSPENKNKKCPGDFLGKNFKNKDMSGLDLSTRLLIAADFEGCILNGSIFLGADTRDTNFSNVDLSQALFLSQGQINASRGNRNTKLPEHLEYPVTWR